MCCLSRSMSSGFIIGLLAAAGVAAISFAMLGGGGLTVAAQPTEPAHQLPKGTPQNPIKALPANPAKIDPAKAQPGGQMDPQIQAWMEMNKVGDMHHRLNFMQGTWKATMKFVMAPGAPTQESTGEQVSKWGYDNRFLTSQFAGEMAPGMKFIGTGILGYNTMSKKYESYWIDSSSNAMMLSTGTSDESGKVFTFSGEGPDMKTGKTVTYKSICKMVDDDHYSFTMFEKAPDGKEFESLVISYSRVK